MTVQRVLLVLLFVAALAGCASDPQMKDTALLAPGQGVMVARLAIPYLAQSGHLKTTISVASLNDGSDAGTPIELHTAETFLVVPLPAGTYRWKDFHIGSYNDPLGGGPMHFDIVAGKINYVGDITVVMAMDPSYQPGPVSQVGKPRYNVNFRIYDYRRVFLPKIAAAYPQLWGSYPVVVSLTTPPDFRLYRNQ
ncbi:hypothetical protein GCM10007862_15660 [Dyella lipolytica]|uniref:Lipoprotein n=1 Tax=Dyella lipolytica TaxID=1867835 RepID=A0ABW8ITI8_9GAMM|nr:hypothetical protein [Dyella lipolytica]GLQ46515.1 hypothetical protein GCM10007862_15660 [Dyella lipolytica]